jgi:hypothetical protein
VFEQGSSAGSRVCWTTRHPKSFVLASGCRLESVAHEARLTCAQFLVLSEEKEKEVRCPLQRLGEELWSGAGKRFGEDYGPIVPGLFLTQRLQEQRELFSKFRNGRHFHS